MADRRTLTVSFVCLLIEHPASGNVLYVFELAE
jgi:hypothetical protein